MQKKVLLLFFLYTQQLMGQNAVIRDFALSDRVEQGLQINIETEQPQKIYQKWIAYTRSFEAKIWKNKKDQLIYAEKAQLFLVDSLKPATIITRFEPTANACQTTFWITLPFQDSLYYLSEKDGETWDKGLAFCQQFVRSVYLDQNRVAIQEATFELEKLEQAYSQQKNKKIQLERTETANNDDRWTAKGAIVNDGKIIELEKAIMAQKEKLEYLRGNLLDVRQD